MVVRQIIHLLYVSITSGDKYVTRIKKVSQKNTCERNNDHMIGISLKTSPRALALVNEREHLQMLF